MLPLHRVEALFTGDAIINGGVGAFFHGGPRDCYDNLHVRLAGMPDAALVFSGHEYMLMNLRFSTWLDDKDEATATALREVVARRHRQLSTMPSSLAVERRVNPYFKIKNRAFLDKVVELKASIEAGKRKRWYRRYLTFSGGGGGGGVNLGKKHGGGGGGDREGEFSGASVSASVGQSLGAPSVAECVQGIKTVQDLGQYRHLLDQGTGGKGGGGTNEDAGKGGKEEKGDEEDGRGGGGGGGGGGSTGGGSRPLTPPPRPVSIGAQFEEESDGDHDIAEVWGGRSASNKRQPPKKNKNRPPQELTNLLDNL
jgi:hypothetical protein